VRTFPDRLDLVSYTLRDLHGWKIQASRPVCLVRGAEELQLFEDEQSVSFTYTRSAGAKAFGGYVLISGRPAELIVVGINEQIASLS